MCSQVGHSPRALGPGQHRCVLGAHRKRDQQARNRKVPQPGYKAQNSSCPMGDATVKAIIASSQPDRASASPDQHSAAPLSAESPDGPETGCAEGHPASGTFGAKGERPPKASVERVRPG